MPWSPLPTNKLVEEQKTKFNSFSCILSICTKVNAHSTENAAISLKSTVKSIFYCNFSMVPGCFHLKNSMFHRSGLVDQWKVDRLGAQNVIFDILEPSAKQKYSICWVFKVINQKMTSLQIFKDYLCLYSLFSEFIVSLSLSLYSSSLYDGRTKGQQSNECK